MKYLADYPARWFRIFAYGASHSCLLLRSTAGDSGEQQIDLGFFGVEWVHLPVPMAGLRMQYATKDQMAGISAETGVQVPGAHRFLVVTGEDYQGYVVADSFEVDESFREYYEADRWEIYPGIEARRKFAD